MSSSITAAMIVAGGLLVASMTTPLVAQRADRLEARNVSIAQTTFKGRSAGS
jgi:hypothetical protein